MCRAAVLTRQSDKAYVQSTKARFQQHGITQLQLVHPTPHHALEETYNISRFCSADKYIALKKLSIWSGKLHSLERAGAHHGPTLTLEEDVRAFLVQLLKCTIRPPTSMG